MVLLRPSLSFEMRVTFRKPWKEIRAHRRPGPVRACRTAPSYIDTGQLRRSGRAEHRKHQSKGGHSISVIYATSAWSRRGFSSRPHAPWSADQAACSSRRRAQGLLQPRRWLTNSPTKQHPTPSPGEHGLELGSEGFRSTAARCLQSSRSAWFPVQQRSEPSNRRPRAHLSGARGLG